MARRPMDERKAQPKRKVILDWTEERARTFPLRFSPKLHQVLKEHAARTKQSLHEYIMQAIKERIERDVT
jgi:predicted HicB family RNase H-like nuclease